MGKLTETKKAGKNVKGRQSKRPAKKAGNQKGRQKKGRQERPAIKKTMYFSTLRVDSHTA